MGKKKTYKCDDCISSIFCKKLNQEIERKFGHLKKNSMDRWRDKIEVMKYFTCEDYKYKYIEFPLDVETIRNKFIEPSNLFKRDFTYVAIMLASEEETHLGIYIGDLAMDISISYSDKDKELSIFPMSNPAIFVPNLKRVVFGAESYWREIEGPEDLDKITNADIENTWYIKALKSFGED